jgi:nucleoside-diphosphate-sugar epimerase
MVIITGASGLLGTVLIDHFVSKNIPIKALYRKTVPVPRSNVEWIDVDVRDINRLTEIFSGATCVIHAAALVSFAKRHKKRMVEVNVQGTANVVNACLSAGVKRLVHISSVAALGKSPLQNLVDEKSPWPGANTPSNYGLTKYLAELEVFRGEAEGLSVGIVNPSVILTPLNHQRSSGVILDYVKKGGAFYTDGTINYVDARDVSEAVFRLYVNPSLSGRYILNGGTLPWKIFFTEVANRFGKRPPFIRVPAGVTLVAAGFEWIRSLIMGGDPIITKETANLARQQTFYSNNKASDKLAMSFRDLKNTLDWCCK